MNKSPHIILAFFLLFLLLPSCGVRKPVPMPPTQEATQMRDATTAKDTLSISQQQTLLNDTSIHINDTYGIPFIIDDSVPMLLPPIDKNPTGYVCSDAYHNRETGSGENRRKKAVFCGILNPIDSLPWLNKCMNELADYIDASSLPTCHLYNITVRHYIVEKGAEFLMIWIYKYPIWDCVAPNTKHKIETYFYTFECDGSLIGKTYSQGSISFKDGKWIGEVEKYPKIEKTLSMLSEKSNSAVIFFMDIIKRTPEAMYIEY